MIHRDIKPANLLLDNGGELWIADFGLAHVGADASCTRTGELLGTLRYMSPEQALVRPVVADHRTDLYSLGATLYELLTLEPVFAGSQRAELIRQIAEVDPRPLRQTQRHIPADLEAIVLKCLEKEPEDRYATARDLAADLSRYLGHQSVTAAAPHTGRKKQQMGSAACHGGEGGSGAVNSGGGRPGARQPAHLARTGRTKAALVLAQNNEHAAESQRRRAEQMTEEVREHLYASDMKLASQAWSSTDVGQVRTLLERHRPAPGRRDLRGFEWHYLWRLCHSDKLTLRGHAGEVYCACFSPDGRQLATASQDSTIKLWDSASGQELLTLRGHTGEVNHVAFSPDGTLLASCSDDETVRLWDAASGKEAAVLSGHIGAVSEVVFSRDGKLLATGGEDKLIRLWDVETRKQIVTLSGHTRQIRGLAFSPDRQTLASGSSDNTIKLWDVETRQERATLRGHTSIVCSVSFSRDSRMLASASWDQTIKLWAVASATERASLTGHLSRVQSVSFSPVDDALVSAGMDGTVRLWNILSGEQRRVLKGHAGRVWSATFSYDGKTLATTGADRTIKVWDSDITAGPIRFVDVPGVRSIAFSPDGQTLAVGGISTRLWNVPAAVQGAARWVETPR